MAKQNYIKIETTEPTLTYELLGAANRISDAKDQFIEGDHYSDSFQRDQVITGCVKNGAIVVIKNIGKDALDTARNAVEFAMNNTSFGFDNQPDQISKIFESSVNLGKIYTKTSHLPQKLTFPVNGDVSLLDTLCTSPAIQVMRAKGVVQK